MPSAAAMAPPVTFRMGVVRLVPLASVNKPPCTVAPPLTVFWANQVLLPVTVRFAADGQRAGHAAAGEGHVVIDLTAAQERAALTRTLLLVNWPLLLVTPKESASPDHPLLHVLPVNGVVVGAPSYTWGLAFCNANTSTSGYCGQTETWYEDDPPR